MGIREDSLGREMKQILNQTETKQINIYIDCTIRFGKAQSGVTGYILEYTTPKGSTGTLSAGIPFESATKYQAEVVTLIKAISRIGEYCSLRVYTDDSWLRSVLNGWMDRWRAEHWIKSDGKVIQNADIISILGVMIGDQEVIAIGDDHPYKRWLHSEIEKAAKHQYEDGIEYVPIPYK